MNQNQPSQESAKTLYSGQTIGTDYQKIYEFETDNFYIVVASKNSQNYYYSVSKRDQTSVWLPAQKLTDDIYQSVNNKILYLVGKNQNEFDFSIWENGQRIIFEEAMAKELSSPNNGFPQNTLGQEYQPLITFETESFQICICQKDNQKYYYSVSKLDRISQLFPVSQVTPEIYQAINNQTVYLVGSYATGCDFSIWEQGKQKLFEQSINNPTIISPSVNQEIPKTVEDILFYPPDLTADVQPQLESINLPVINQDAPVDCSLLGTDNQQKIHFETPNFWVNICLKNNEYYYYSVNKNNRQEQIYLLAEKISEHSYKANQGSLDYIISDNSKGYYLSIWENEVQIRYEEELPKETQPEKGEYSCEALGSDYQGIISFETKNYYVNICRQGNQDYHYSVPKHNPENSVVIPTQKISDSIYEAVNENTTYVVSQTQEGGEFYIWEEGRQIVFETQE